MPLLLSRGVQFLLVFVEVIELARPLLWALRGKLAMVVVVPLVLLSLAMRRPLLSALSLFSEPLVAVIDLARLVLPHGVAMVVVAWKSLKPMEWQGGRGAVAVGLALLAMLSLFAPLKCCLPLVHLSRNDLLCGYNLCIPRTAHQCESGDS